MNVMISVVTTWPGTMIGKPGGYGITKLAETSSGPLSSRSSISGLASLTYSQLGGVVGHVVRLAHVAFLGGALRVVAEGVVEAAEVRQVRHVLDEGLHPRLEGRASSSPPSASRFSIVARDVGQRLDQVREVAARVVDVDLDEHAVARGLVDLDVVLAGEQRLELACRRSRRRRRGA